jgi:hypothetical protein
VCRQIAQEICEEMEMREGDGWQLDFDYSLPSHKGPGDLNHDFKGN